MLRLLPYHFKKIGFIISPIGLFLWIFMQKGYVSKISQSLGLVDATPLNIIIATLGILSFLFGIYAIGFSKEKVEDEMIKNIRLESLRLAALVQIVLIVIGLTVVGIMKNPPKDAGMMLFFIMALLVFWIIYIIRFNFIVHFRVYGYEE